MKQIFWPVLKEVIFNIALIGWCLIYGCITLPIILFFPTKTLVNICKPWAKGIMVLLKFFYNITYIIKGLENLPKEQGYIIASKHQSALDTILLCLIIPQPAFIIKKQLFYLPFVGWYLYFAQMIAINRRAGIAAVKKIILEAKARIKEGRNLIIFPEGTRVKIGASEKYKAGVVALYHSIDAPLIPVALNSGIVWGHNIFSIKIPGKVVLEFLPSIKRGFSKSEMIEQLYNTIETKTAQLCEFS